MKLIRLNTLDIFPDLQGTVGMFYIDDEFVCYTIEREWNNNLPFVSCIPPGEYDLFKFNHIKYGGTFVVYNPLLDVYIHRDDRVNPSDRFECIIHPANFMHELQGCIAPAFEVGTFRGQWRSFQAREAMRLLQSKWRSRSINKLIIETDGKPEPKSAMV